MTDQSQNKTIGFIGAGRIGRPLIRALLAAGFRVNVYDKHKSAAKDVLALGANWAATPRDAADDARAVITCLARPEHVWNCMMDATGALAGMSKGAVWINTSTTDYHSSLQIADAAKAKGVFSLEGPVSNLSHMGVDFGNSSIYCAGDHAGYIASKDILEAVTKISFFTGEIGTAQAVKLLTNLVFYGSVSLCGDCLAITQSAGIPCHWMWEKIRSSKANSVAAAQFIPMLLDGSYDTSCSLEIGVKDMSLTIALADELGVALPLGRVVYDRYALAGEQIDQSENHLMVTRLSEDANGLMIRITDFKAPSKYGSNPQFAQSDVMDTDAFGRVTPKLPPTYDAPAFTPTPAQQDVVDAVLVFMAETNHILNEEAIALGMGVGLEREGIKKMIIWSVGTNWVLENPQANTPTLQGGSNISTHITSLKLPLIEAALNVINA